MKKQTHLIVSDLKRVASELGKRPTREEYKGLGKFSQQQISKELGSYTEACVAAGLLEKPKEVLLRKPKILLWDIEASDLAANFGFCFCIGYKWFGEKETHLISIRDFPKSFAENCTNDMAVVAAFSDVMAQADVQVTWYGQRFDFPFIQTRLLEHCLPPLAPVPHIDGWRIAKYKLRFNSNRLESVSRFIAGQVGSKQEFKTQFDPKCWVRAKAGHEPSLRFIEEHCIADVKVLENVFLQIRPFASSLPNISKLLSPKVEACPSCGSVKLQRRGFSVTPRGKFQRVQCQSCTHWFGVPSKFSVDPTE